MTRRRTEKWIAVELTHRIGITGIYLCVMIRLALFLNADNHAIFLTFGSFCNQTVSKVKNGLECSRPKVEICHNSKQNFVPQKNVGIKFCSF